MLSFIHSLNNHKTLRYLTRKPRGRILARGPASVGAARGPKLNTKESSRKGLFSERKDLRPPAPGTAFRLRSKQMFRSARERQGRAREGGPHPSLFSSSLHPASPGPNRLGEAQKRGRFRPVPPGSARRPPPRSPAAASATTQGHSSCESRGARDVKRPERCARGWAPGPRPRSGRLARPELPAVLSAPRRWAAPAALRAGREEAG